MSGTLINSLNPKVVASLVAQWKNLPANAGDMGSIRGPGKSPGEGNGNPLQCSCLGNPMGRGAWRATVRGVAKHLDTTEHICAHSVINAVF